MEIRPLHDRVIVRRVEEKKTTASGLIIPDSSAEKPSRGEIVAAGKGKISAQGDLIPLDVKVGDEVVVHSGWWEPEDPWVLSGKDPMLAPSVRIWGYQTNYGSYCQFARAQSQPWDQLESNPMREATPLSMRAHRTVEPRHNQARH